LSVGSVALFFYHRGDGRWHALRECDTLDTDVLCMLASRAWFLMPVVHHVAYLAFLPTPSPLPFLLPT